MSYLPPQYGNRYRSSYNPVRDCYDPLESLSMFDSIGQSAHPS